MEIGHKSLEKATFDMILGAIQPHIEKQTKGDEGKQKQTKGNKSK